MQSKFQPGATECEWVLPRQRGMRVPGIVYATRDLLSQLDLKALEQLENVASLPGIVNAAYAMPDTHQGYGFPIGGVAAFDPYKGGVVSAGGVGFDIACGVRTLLSTLSIQEINRNAAKLLSILAANIPAGVASRGKITLQPKEMEAMLLKGAVWAVEKGYGNESDLRRVESRGLIPDAKPDKVSAQAQARQKDQMGTLGSGNHYLEIQQIDKIFDSATANVFGLSEKMIVISIHCGSRGLGHQVATDYIAEMAKAAPRYGLQLPDRDLACAPIDSPTGENYLGAMRAAANCALANRQIITALTRDAFRKIFKDQTLPLLFDVSHNFCRPEKHPGKSKSEILYVHRKGATAALPPGHPDLPFEFQPTGQPVLVGGSMGTASYILAGMQDNLSHGFSSACHGAGRRLSRTQARRQWRSGQILQELAGKGILVHGESRAGIAEEAPDAYKDIHEVVKATEKAGLARRVASLKPVMCLKG